MWLFPEEVLGLLGRLAEVPCAWGEHAGSRAGRWGHIPAPSTPLLKASSLSVSLVSISANLGQYYSLQGIIAVAFMRGSLA